MFSIRSRVVSKLREILSDNSSLTFSREEFTFPIEFVIFWRFSLLFSKKEFCKAAKLSSTFLISASISVVLALASCAELIYLNACSNCSYFSVLELSIFFNSVRESLTALPASTSSAISSSLPFNAESDF